MAKTIINVSNRLPVTLGEGKVTRSSGGLIAALEGMGHHDYDLKWLGWPGTEVADAQSLGSDLHGGCGLALSALPCRRDRMHVEYAEHQMA